MYFYHLLNSVIMKYIIQNVMKFVMYFGGTMKFKS
jgi:hypothetical protein